MLVSSVFLLAKGQVCGLISTSQIHPYETSTHKPVMKERRRGISPSLNLFPSLSLSPTVFCTCIQCGLSSGCSFETLRLKWRQNSSRSGACWWWQEFVCQANPAMRLWALLLKTELCAQFSNSPTIQEILCVL